MTAKTSQRLADVLRLAGLEDMARKAEADRYHDFLSDDPVCAITLANDLAAAFRNVDLPSHTRDAAEQIRRRHLNGDFDADAAESEAWAASPEGQDAFKQMIDGPLGPRGRK